MSLSSTKDVKQRISAAGTYLKRDWSREQPINLPVEESSSHTQSPELGCVSVKSDMSREQPVGFQKEDAIPRSRLCDCGITEAGCSALSLALSSNPSHLRELDLSSNKISDSGVKLISDNLADPQCVLKKLGLFNCEVTGKGCAALVSALMLNPSHLRELNLGGNDLTKSALDLLLALVQDPFCALDKLDSGIQHA
ncbi:ribonuclease inhibitor-like [Tachysurus vachellii]|uniref:ribonuclease inhibitor-like n=1 Tax=Tachysurus vachellii TaxID=175792 RepID=UPI00296ADF45|nr:ribonuclease inhibitor-like [Tachysurus vachellii]XP_060715662.1 ribonuclease inhibitor-like [Tachysurus vachellii]XP_060715663.1 ribonuclease inhibitor-like [Tachysurus vachellii]